MAPLPQRLLAEAAGTALLLAVIVGSGIMGERLANGNAAIALLANSLATGCGLAALIVVFAPISGAHFNPLVSLPESSFGPFRLFRMLHQHGETTTAATREDGQMAPTRGPLTCQNNRSTDRARKHRHSSVTPIPTW